MSDDAIEGLELRLTSLRAALRGAVSAGDKPRAGALKAELRTVEEAWDQAVEMLALDPAPCTPASQAAGVVQRTGGSLLALREQVHSALTLLTVPAAPKLIAQVYNACFGGGMNSAKLTSLRRDDQRSFRTAPFTRPYYLCAALTADRLAPARALLAVSTWPLERRIVGPLGPRVDFLTAAISVAGHIDRLSRIDPAVARLLELFAGSISGAASSRSPASPDTVIHAAQAELHTHAPIDRSQREAAADRARTQLDEPGRLFGLPKD